MSEFYDEYTDDEEPEIEVSKSLEKYQKMIDEILVNTQDLVSTAENLEKTENTLQKVQKKVKPEEKKNTESIQAKT